jgi:prepilin-type N-terminal cleavage/methylation domain-containing protein
MLVQSAEFIVRGLLTKDHRRGFTLAEVLIVVAIIVIAAMIAVPMMSSGGSVQVQSAANMIAADLEYAKSMAIGRQQNYSVVFDAASESYEVRDASGSVISHPVKKGFNYVVDFSNDSSLDDVDISSVDFDPGSSDSITFDYLGSPYSGTGTLNSLNNGNIILQGGGVTRTITVEPTTGFISISE